MTVFSVILFIHLVGALTLFAGMGLEWRALRYFGLAGTVEELRMWTGAASVLPALNGIAAAAILLPGFYLAAKLMVWPQGWISISLLATFAIAGLGMAVTGPRTRALRKAVAEGSGALPEDIRQKARASGLRVSFRLRVWLGLGIVLLMASRPGMVTSLVVIGVAIAAGLLLSWI